MNHMGCAVRGGLIKTQSSVGQNTKGKVYSGALSPHASPSTVPGGRENDLEEVATQQPEESSQTQTIPLLSIDSPQPAEVLGMALKVLSHYLLAPSP